MGKVTTFQGVVRFSKETKNKGKTLGLVVGSFDILHLGHIHLFQFAKKHSAFLVVGLDNDQTIKLVKGKNRPVNNFKRRSELLAELTSVDKIFLIEKIAPHGSEEALENYKEIVKKIKPTHLFTHRTCDKHWREKKKIAEEEKIALLIDRSPEVTHSGTILDKLSSEF